MTVRARIAPRWTSGAPGGKISVWSGLKVRGMIVAWAGRWIAAVLVLSACAQQDGGTAEQPETPAPAPATKPAPAPAPQVRQANYNLNGGSMIVVTEPAPEVRRTSATLDLVQPKSLLDVARQATVRIANADADPLSVINAVQAPTTDVALSIERTLLERLANVFSLGTTVNQVDNPQRAFPFTSEGAQILAGQIRSAGLGGYVLDARTNYLDIETSGGTISNPVERFKLIGQVAIRLIDVSDGRVIRQAVCTDTQPMGTLREIFIAEGKPVPERARSSAAPTEEPVAEPAGETESDEPRSEDETSAAALALIEKTDGSGEPAEPADGATATVPGSEPSATDPEARSIAQEAVTAVTQPATPVAPLGQPTAEDRVQDALRQAPAAPSEVAAEEARQNYQRVEDSPAGQDVPLRRTGAFADVVQDAMTETADPGAQPAQAVTVQTDGVKEKARLEAAALVAAQAIAPASLPGPGASGRVSDGAAERLTRKCTEDLWQKIAPE